MHPYNAVHVVRLPGAPDEDRLRASVDRTLETRAVTGLILNPKRGTYCYTAGPAHSQIKELHPEPNARAVVAGEIEQQLNTPFQLDRPFTPFRFFTVPDGDCFALGLVYLHAVADAESVVLLVKEIANHYACKGADNRGQPSEPVPSLRGNRLLAHSGAFARKCAELPSSIRNLRCSCRPPCRDPEDLVNGFALFTVEPRRLLRLVTQAKQWRITVNDLLLALFLRACAQLGAGREQAERRRNISLGCIVNTRREVAGEDGGIFGLFLGSFIVTHAVPTEMGLEELAKDVGRITTRVKSKKLYLATALELHIGRLLLAFFPPELRKKLYPKHYPLWGGLTNMNINPLWAWREGDLPLEYFRAVSTGPVTPMVISFTTAGETAHIGLSYRRSFFSASAIEQVARCFQEPEVRQ